MVDPGEDMETYEGERDLEQDANSDMEFEDESRPSGTGGAGASSSGGAGNPDSMIGIFTELNIVDITGVFSPPRVLMLGEKLGLRGGRKAGAPRRGGGGSALVRSACTVYSNAGPFRDRASSWCLPGAERCPYTGMSESEPDLYATASDANMFIVLFRADVSMTAPHGCIVNARLPLFGRVQ